MSRYYRLLEDVALPNRWYLGEACSGGRPVLNLLNGERIVASEPFDIDVTRAGQPLDFSFTSFAEPVVKAKLAASILAAAQDDVQLLQAVVGGSREFRVLNVLHWVDCLDEARSEFTRWTLGDSRPDLVGQYKNVARLHIDQSKIPYSRHLFRIANYPVVLIASDKVRSAMITSGCRGAKFIELN
jgi:hypothetical protein